MKSSGFRHCSGTCAQPNTSFSSLHFETRGDKRGGQWFELVDLRVLDSTHFPCMQGLYLLTCPQMKPSCHQGVIFWAKATIPGSGGWPQTEKSPRWLGLKWCLFIYSLTNVCLSTKVLGTWGWNIHSIPQETWNLVGKVKRFPKEHVQWLVAECTPDQ